MIFEQLAIEGVYRVRLDPHRDERGFFARAFCSDEFGSRHLPLNFEQLSLSRNTRRGTLRGMHFQVSPDEETKLVRCVRGRIFDVALDLRKGSPSYGRWLSEMLDADQGDALLIPPGVGHGFQTLEDGCDVLYQITPAFRPGLGQGVRWDDPKFGIDWPIRPAILSDRDASYPDWTP